ncbi:hypothetical protein GQ457_04G016710 [Hibiscus cannabinus]
MLSTSDQKLSSQLKTMMKPTKSGRRRSLNIWHDKKIHPRKYMPGQQVLLFNSRLKPFPGKLKFRWSGPFEITKVSPP